MKATICVGISASGKTTWALQQTNSMIVSRDDLRREILERELQRKLEPGELWKIWKFKREKEVNSLQDIYFTKAKIENVNLIIADTNLDKNFNAALEKRLKDLGFEIEYQWFPIDLVEAWKRDKGRADSVGYDVIYRQYIKWLEITKRKKYIANIQKPKALIVDIDGTLARMKNRGPFDWSMVGQDELDHAVSCLVFGFYLQLYKIIILSGRDSVCRRETEEWLAKHMVNQAGYLYYDKLFMRAEGDSRKDSIIKEEIFWNHISDNYNVVAVVDDRPQMTRMWRELGIKVFDVGDPYIEF
jgi:predicted kinase